MRTAAVTNSMLQTENAQIAGTTTAINSTIQAAEQTLTSGAATLQENRDQDINFGTTPQPSQGP